MTCVLIMAGGKSERMRASGDACHKALRPVAGISLLERNICHALAYGLKKIFVAVNARETSLREFLDQHGQELASSANASITTLVEESPLGTIGIARELAAQESDVLVLNVDNLSTLNFEKFLERHRSQAAAMTIAVHEEGFQVPLGEVIVESGRIIDYREKPTHPVTISSGAYLLAPRTCEWIAPKQRTDIPDLIPMLRERTELIAAFEHESHWIDINDEKTLDRAEKLVAAHAVQFGRLMDFDEYKSARKSLKDSTPIHPEPTP